MDELEETLAIPREEMLLVSAKEGTGVPAVLQALVDRQCTLVDTTCGSVLNVWKNVKRYVAGA